MLRLIFCRNSGALFIRISRDRRGCPHQQSVKIIASTAIQLENQHHQTFIFLKSRWLLFPSRRWCARKSPFCEPFASSFGAPVILLQIRISWSTATAECAAVFPPELGGESKLTVLWLNLSEWELSAVEQQCRIWTAADATSEFTEIPNERGLN